MATQQRLRNLIRAVGETLCLLFTSEKAVRAGEQALLREGVPVVPEYLLIPNPPFAALLVVSRFFLVIRLTVELCQ